MKRILLMVMAMLFSINLSWSSELGLKPEIGQWRTASDDWRTTDKLAHGLFYSWVAREWTDILKDKRAGAGISLGIGLLNELKDAYIPWETHGAIGGDGWSWRDIAADCAGIAWALWFEEDTSKRKGLYCARPLSELWPKLGTATAIGLGWTGGCLVYNFATAGRALPNGSGKWKKISGDKGGFQHVLSDFNGEISFIGPWWMNSNLRPYLPLGWRVLGISATLVGWEQLNGYLRQDDVPFWGADGFRDGDLSVGALSLTGVIVYEVFFFPKNALCIPYYTVGPTLRGLGLTFYW